MMDFLDPLHLFDQGPPNPAVPGVNAPVDKNEGKPDSIAGQIGQTIGDFTGGLAQEGLAGLLDPTGMMDRQTAQRDLAKKFDVVPDDFTGQKLPNQVTQAEYQNIAHTYSDIRLGRSDLQIDASTAADPDQYRADMMDDIGDIMQTASGRTLVGQLANDTNGVDGAGNPIHHTTTLTPGLDGAGQPDSSRVGESGNSSAGVGSPFADGRPGAGGDTQIKMNPNVDAVVGGGTWRSDVALYHEMVHSYHDTQGTTDSTPVQASDGVQREIQRGNLGGAIHEILNPDQGIADDAAVGINRYEHQAAGLGVHADDPLSENAYRRERNSVALSGKGMAGDLLMPQRDKYLNYSGTYNSFFGL